VRFCCSTQRSGRVLSFWPRRSGYGQGQTVGRATLGLVDYANCLTIDYSDIMACLTYPISRAVANLEGTGGSMRTSVCLLMFTCHSIRMSARKI
jgi:hypothetical protein